MWLGVVKRSVCAQSHFCDLSQADRSLTGSADCVYWRAGARRACRIRAIANTGGPYHTILELETHGKRLPSSTPFHSPFPTFIINGTLMKMRRLYRLLFFLSIPIGPVLAQANYPNCSAGWDWVSISQFPYTSPLLISDHDPFTIISRTIP